MFAKQPLKPYKLGDPLPAIPGAVVSWPWPGSPALTKWSLDMLHYPLGTLIYDVVDGHPVLAQIQTHSWYGAHPDWPATPHKGTSVFVPATVSASGKKVPIADPPDGWGEESSTVAGVSDGEPATTCAPGDPLCTDLPDESAPPPPPPKKRHPMNTVFLNGRPTAGFGVGERFCPSLPYVCPPRPWGPDPGPRASIADRLGTGAPPPPRTAAIQRERAAARARAVRAHETALARAWRPQWGQRPVGFGAAQWRREWGARPAWFGARQWRREWGAEPAWWGAHLTVQQTEPPPDDSQPAGDGSSAPANGTPASATAPDQAPITPDASAPIASDVKPGLSTAAKVGIGVGVLAVGGGIVAVVRASGKK